MKSTLFALLAATLCLLACAKDEAKSAGPGATAPAADGPRYTVRGEVKSVDATTKQVSIHHETIPDFKNREGKATGMMAMEMSFRIGGALTASDLTAGDKIEFVFVVDWDASPPIEVVEAKKLAPETELTL